MKSRRLIAVLMILVTLCTCETAYANEDQYSDYIVPKEGVENFDKGNKYTWQTNLYANIDTSYSVILPKRIKIDSATKSAKYTVKVSGDLGGEDAVLVDPDPSFELITSGKPAVTAVITQEQNRFMSNEITGDGTQTTGTIDAAKLSAGTWDGRFNFSVSVISYKPITLDYTYGQYTDLLGNPISASGDFKIPEFIQDSDGQQYVVTGLSNNLFAGNKNITSVTVPGSVRMCSASAFYSCSNLTSVHLLDGVKIIGESCFNNCKNLVSVDLPDSLVEIEHNSFFDCSSLSSVNIPDNVTKISDGAFCRCVNLKTAKISNNITKIEGSTFFGCSNLISIEIPDSITTIEQFAFKGCNSLTSLVIPNGVTSIALEAFSNCSNIESVVLPDSLKSMGKYVFISSPKLSSVTYKGTTYTSKSALINTLTQNGVSLIDNVTGNSGQFDKTALSE